MNSCWINIYEIILNINWIALDSWMFVPSSRISSIHQCDLIFISSLHKACQLIHRDDIACRRCQNFWATSMVASSAMPNSCKSSWKTGRASEAFLARKLNAVKSKKEVLQYSYTTWNMLQKAISKYVETTWFVYSNRHIQSKYPEKSDELSQFFFLQNRFQINNIGNCPRFLTHQTPSVSSGAHSHKSCCCNPGSFSMWWGGSWLYLKWNQQERYTSNLNDHKRKIPFHESISKLSKPIQWKLVCKLVLRKNDTHLLSWMNQTLNRNALFSLDACRQYSLLVAKSLDNHGFFQRMPWVLKFPIRDLPPIPPATTPFEWSPCLQRLRRKAKPNALSPRWSRNSRHTNTYQMGS